MLHKMHKSPESKVCPTEIWTWCINISLSFSQLIFLHIRFLWELRLHFFKPLYWSFWGDWCLDSCTTWRMVRRRGISVLFKDTEVSLFESVSRLEIANRRAAASSQTSLILVKRWALAAVWRWRYREDGSASQKKHKWEIEAHSYLSASSLWVDSKHKQKKENQRKSNQ